MRKSRSRELERMTACSEARGGGGKPVWRSSLRGDFKRDESYRNPVGGDSPDNAAAPGEDKMHRFREFAEIKGLCLIFAMFYAKLH